MMLPDRTLDQLRQEMVLNQAFKQQNILSQNEAEVSLDKNLRPRWMTRVVLDLSTAQEFAAPYDFNEPFDGFYVESATDSTTNVKIAVTSPEMSHITNYMTVKASDSVAFGRTVNRAILSWAAQSGHTITLVFFQGAKFQSGSMRQVLSGGVTLTRGDGMAPAAKVSVGVAATQIFTADSSRKAATIQNIGGVDIYISGTNAVTLDSGANPGIKLVPGASYEWINAGACYGIANGAACYVSLNTES